MTLADAVNTILNPIRALRGEHEERISFEAALEDISRLPHASLSGSVVLHRKEGMEILAGVVEGTSVSTTSSGVMIAQYLRTVKIPTVSPDRTVAYVQASSLDGRLSVTKVTGKNEVRYGVQGDIIDPSKHKFFGFKHAHHYQYSYEVLALQNNSTSS